MLVDQADCKSGCSTTILGRLIEDQKCSTIRVVVDQADRRSEVVGTIRVVYDLKRVALRS